MKDIEEQSIENVYVMYHEPIINMSVDDIRNLLSENNDIQVLVDTFAAVHNKAWWVEDDVYDFEEGTEEYKKACEIKDEWFRLMDELLEKIFCIIRSEGVIIPEANQNEIIAPFMEKYGYFDGNGWWIKKNEQKGETKK